MNQKKFIESVNASGISVLTDTGYQPIQASHETIPYDIWKIKTSSGKSLLCADLHILFNKSGDEVFVKDLKKGDLIKTDMGVEEITEIQTQDQAINMYDLSVDSEDHRYLTNGILSHNSTVTLDILSNAKNNGARVLFISAEMNQIDLYLYVERFPKFGDIEIFFPQELEDGANPAKELERILSQGWDIVLIDSLIELQQIIQEESQMTSNRAEKYMLGLMYQQNLGNNERKSNTSFLLIQQVNKGGNFVGSNKLKHMTTGMMEIRFVDPEEDDGERFVVFSKNRRGNVGKAMYFDLANGGDVEYDTARFRKSEELKELKKKEKEKIQNSGHDFDALFGLTDEEKAEAEEDENGVEKITPVDEI